MTKEDYEEREKARQKLAVDYVRLVTHEHDREHDSHSVWSEKHKRWYYVTIESQARSEEKGKVTINQQKRIEQQEIEIRRLRDIIADMTIQRIEEKKS